LHGFIGDELALVVLQVEPIQIVKKLVHGVREHLVVRPHLEVSDKKLVSVKVGHFFQETVLAEVLEYLLGVQM